MELKVWVEGIQRIVCGVTEATTCQDVVYALAHATGKTGRFTLVEKWRSNERLLTNHEHPLKVLSKWGEYANDVQLILRRSAADGGKTTQDVHRGMLDCIQELPSNRLGKSVSPCGSSSKEATGKKCCSPCGVDGTTNREQRDQSGGGVAPRGVKVLSQMQQQQADIAQRDVKNNNVTSGNNVREHGGNPVKEVYGTSDILSSLGSTSSNHQQQHRHHQHHYHNQGGKQIEQEPVYGKTVATAQNGRMAVVGNSATQLQEHQWRSVPVTSTLSGVGVHATSQASTDGAQTTSAFMQIQHEKIPASSDVARLNNGARQHRVLEPHGRTETNGPSSLSKSALAAAAAAVPNVQIASHESYALCDARYIGYNNLKHSLPQQQQQNTEQTTTSGNYVSHHNQCNGLNVLVPTTHYHHHHHPGLPVVSSQGSSQVIQYESNLKSGLSSPTALNNNNNNECTLQQRQHNSYSPVSSAGATVVANPVPVHLGTPKSRRNLLSEFKRHDLEEELHEDSLIGRQERVVYNARYRDLVQLINLQREKLTRQKADLTQYDAEITYWEEKQKDHKRQIDKIECEIQQVESSGRAVEEEAVQLDTLHLESEFEVGIQQEKTLQSELTLLRSKLANSETELLQCKNKIRLVLDSISDDERRIAKEEDDRKQREVAILGEIDELQKDIQATIRDHESKVGLQTESSEKFHKDVKQLECIIADKKKQVEGLVREMKEANLESLTFTPSEEIRHLLEGGVNKGLGSSRKIVGSPRQLENAVPTSKNPHGVWV